MNLGEPGDILVYKEEGKIFGIDACGIILDNKSPLIYSEDTEGNKEVQKYGYSVYSISEVGETIYSKGVDYGKVVAVIRNRMYIDIKDNS